MKTAKIFFVCGVLVSMFLSSCTMQKCVYSKGYYVDWFGKGGNNKKEINKDEKNVIEDVVMKEEATQFDQNNITSTEHESPSINTEMYAAVGEEVLVLDEKKIHSIAKVMEFRKIRQHPLLNLNLSKGQV